MAAAKQPPLTVEDALVRVLDGVAPLVGTRVVDLLSASGMVLAEPLHARHTQPPFDASAMDGYAVRLKDVATLPARLRVVGAAAAGHRFNGAVGAGEAARIFTGAPVPSGADAIVIQENTELDAQHVIITSGSPDAEHIRPGGGDFAVGNLIIPANARLSTRDITLAAAGGHARLTVRRAPIVAILATGDELVMPGVEPNADQIVCSNPYGIAAMVTAAGGEPHLLGIAKDTRASLDAHIASAAGADILVTLGGASVGDHDLVGPALAARGLDLAFWKIAMRPGKPMMFGRLGSQRVLGLPGNPVSSLITARLFLVPLIRKLLGLVPEPPRRQTAPLAISLEANGPRTHYMRAVWQQDSEGVDRVRPLPNQDSSLLTPLAIADCLIVRPIGAPLAAAGDRVEVLPMDF